VPDAASFLLLPVIPLLLIFCPFCTARSAWGRSLGATLNPVPHRLRLAPRGISDATLYSAVVDRVMHGENYYAAAAAMHRTLVYPTASAAVFREPTLAWALAAMRTGMIRRAVLFALSLVTFFALRRAMADAGISTRTRLLAIPLIGTGLAVAWSPTSFYLHETWAAPLIALSLASYRPGRWLMPAIVGVTACFIRELAFPYLIVMAAFAAYERRNRELLAWCAGMLLFAAFFAWHLSAASGLHPPGGLCLRRLVLFWRLAVRA
jgi:hypothetical protein